MQKVFSMFLTGASIGLLMGFLEILPDNLLFWVIVIPANFIQVTIWNIVYKKIKK